VNTIPEIGVDELIDRYAALLLDAYGVLVHSAGALPGAAELIETLNGSATRYYVLTNDASKLPTTAAARYRSYGLALDADQVITSGSLLAGYFAAHALPGARCAVLGTSDSEQYVEQAGGRVRPATEPFDVLVIADEFGYPFLDTADAALTTLFRQLDRGRSVQLVLPNPDRIYPAAADGFGFASGSVAAMFEGALEARYPGRPPLRFARLGKPEAPMFAEALRRTGTRDMVVLGDQLETDIRGARSFGLDSALVQTGGAPATLEGVPADLRPTYIVRSLRPARFRR
jgi:HAD superfamily hydrolase (TIGR01450 family)